MDDSAAKTNLHTYLRHEREAVLAKLDGLSDYDVRRPLTASGTNLLGLVKHLATWEARYLGEVFARPFPEPLSRWDVEEERLADMWATEHESRADVVDRYRRVWAHADATIEALDLTSTGRVEWWGDAEVPLFNVLVHVLAETSRHAGHADILREEIDGAVGTDAEAMAAGGHDAAFWAERRARIEAAARSTR
ncbi:DinB family protein [Nocardioides okcheonensis]|uniref:DinB family protein n=1 Tax=Nocardioides okcheonensis TaxID=2894081 RepID=UPI001E65742D|nr:DinB family protein [Nocardioides okcheonensis]UFN42698.1 DinB family protein [Nocardioides okcheonensis]